MNDSFIYMFGFAVFAILVFCVALYVFPHKVTLGEIAIGVVVQCLVVFVFHFSVTYSQGMDTQIYNGEVTAKEKVSVSCEHSYSCNCRTSCSGGKTKTCSTVCSTCYEHSHDYSWMVRTNLSDIEIARVDRQGVEEPPRWTSVNKGEPVAMAYAYYNYVKASPFTLFNREAMESKEPVPAYMSPHDYYRINRVTNLTSYSITGALNDLLNEKLRSLGPNKKVNINVILHNKGAYYAEVVKAKLLGGKINDVTVLIGISPDGTIENAAAFSWSKSDVANVLIRDGILAVGKYDALKIADAITIPISLHYEHRSIRDFEYLDDEAHPIPTWALVMLLTFGFVFPFGYSFVAYRHDIC